MVDVLITNDDGYESAAYLSLINTIKNGFSALCIAPKGKISWISKALSYNNDLTPMIIKKSGNDIIIVNGTPADCVQLGVYHFSLIKPKLVLSGINLGENLGVAKIYSSGTIGAAIEGCLAGIPSIAASIELPFNSHLNIEDYYDVGSQRYFSNASEIVYRFTKFIFQYYLHYITIYSLNIPFAATCRTKIQIVIPSASSYGSLFEEVGTNFRLKDHRKAEVSRENNDDVNAVLAGRVSVSFLPLWFRSEEVDVFKMQRKLNAFWERHNE